MKLITKQIIHALEDMISFIFNNKELASSYNHINLQYDFGEDYVEGNVIDGYEQKNSEQLFFYGDGRDHFVIGINSDLGDDEDIYIPKIIEKYGAAKKDPTDDRLNISRYPEIFIYIAGNRENALEYFQNTDKELFVELDQPIGPEGIYLVGDMIGMPDDYTTELPYYYNVSLNEYLKDRTMRRIMVFKDPPYDWIEEGNNSPCFTEIHMVIIEPEYEN